MGNIAGSRQIGLTILYWRYDTDQNNSESHDAESAQTGE